MKTSFRCQQNLQNSWHMSNQDQFTAPKQNFTISIWRTGFIVQINLLMNLLYARSTSQSKSRWWSSISFQNTWKIYTKGIFQRQFTLKGRGLLEQIILILIAETILLKAHYPRVKKYDFFNFLVKPNLNCWAY